MQKNDTYRNMVENLRLFDRNMQGMMRMLTAEIDRGVWKQLGEQAINFKLSIPREVWDIQNRIDALETTYRSLTEAGRVARELASRIDYASFARIGECTTLYARFEDAEWRRWQKVFESYGSDVIVSQMERLIPHLQDIAQEFFEAAKKLDITDIDAGEDSITYNGVEYSQGELSQELDKEIDAAKHPDLTVREKFEQLKQKWWLLLLILNLIIAIPDVPEKVEFYNKVINEMQATVTQQSRICFTIKEKSYLRDGPSSSAKKVLTLLYDTPLEIIENIPRWYQVKYTDANGEEIIAWISKISVETEE